MNSCPILFCQKDKSMMETCMCWGIECGEGWYKPLNTLCQQLEQLNKTYHRKYRIRIQADQVKEKFGGLRFYHSVHVDPPWYKRVVGYPFNFINKFIDKHVKFQYETIVDQPAHTEEHWEKISKEDFDNKKPGNSSNDYGWKFKEQDGEYYRNMCVHCGIQSHRVLKNHFVLDKIRSKCFIWYYNIISHKLSKKQQFISDMIYDIADALVQRCENKCWDTCEYCGAENTTDSSNIITTSGWIKRICKKCAQQSYDKNTKLYDEQNPNNEYVGKPRITLFKEGYRFLNFYVTKPFEYKNQYYCSIPHALYSIKDPTHKHIYDSVAHNCGKDSVSYLIEEIAKQFGIVCDENDYDLLKEIVIAKYTNKYNNIDRDDLLNTNDKLLINMNRYCDNLWGVCVCDKCNQKLGKNLYGKILMEVRDFLKTSKTNNCEG